MLPQLQILQMKILSIPPLLTNTENAVAAANGILVQHFMMSVSYMEMKYTILIAVAVGNPNNLLLLQRYIL